MNTSENAKEKDRQLNEIASIQSAFEKIISDNATSKLFNKTQEDSLVNNLKANVASLQDAIRINNIEPRLYEDFKRAFLIEPLKQILEVCEKYYTPTKCQNPHCTEPASTNNTITLNENDKSPQWKLLCQACITKQK